MSLSHADGRYLLPQTWRWRAVTAPAAATSWTPSRQDMDALAPLLDAIGSVHAPRPLGPPQSSFNEGDGVRIVGLTSASGVALNGLEGRVNAPINTGGRHCVYVAGRGVMLKPENLRKVLLTPDMEEASAADADEELNSQVRKLVQIMEDSREEEDTDSLFMGLFGRIRQNPKMYYKLGVHLERIFQSIRKWRGVSRDRARLYVHGYADGSRHIMCNGGGEDGAEWVKHQTHLVQGANRAVLLLGSMMHLSHIRRKAQHADMIEVLAEIIAAPNFHPYALETELQCASSLLNNPTSHSNRRHLAYLERCFPGEGPGVAAVSNGIPTPIPMYTRLREIYSTTGETTFTHDCVLRLLRWSVAYMTSETKALEILDICREVIAEEAETAHDFDGTRYCSADRCLLMEEEGGRPFSKCEQCRLARYCSRECQKFDWKHGGHKHDCRPVE